MDDEFIAGKAGRALADFSPGRRRAAPAAEPVTAKPAPPELLLSALLERFVASQSPAEEADVRYVWRRFVEFVGDVDAKSVTTDQAEEWVLAVKRFPVTRQPDVMAKDFPSILAAHTDTFRAFFKTLQADFNGDVFVAPCSFEPDLAPPTIFPAHLSILARFRSGKEEMGRSGQQRVLGLRFPLHSGGADQRRL